MRAIRYDRVGRVYLDRAGVTPPPGGMRARVDETTGFLHVRDVNIARSGLLAYTDGQSIWNELRTDAELIKAAPSFSNNVFTNTHPAEMVTTANVARVQAGTVGNVTVQGKFLVADEIIIRDRASIDRASEPGGWELSIGFFADVVPFNRGTVDGEQVRFEQTGLEGNHTAGVEQGRAGPECRLPGTDSARSVVALADYIAHQHQPATAEGVPMKTEEEQKAAAELKAKKDAADAKAKTDAEAKAKIDAEAAEAKTKAAEATVEAALKTAEAAGWKRPAVQDEGKKPEPKIDHAKLVRDRVSLVDKASKILDSIDHDADDRTIQIAVIAKVDGAESIIDSADWSNDQVLGSFNSAVRAHTRGPKVDTASQIQRMTGHSGSGGKVEKIDLNEEYAKMTTVLRDAHRKPAAHQEARSA